ncbi:CrcB family protein [Streptomyces sp. Da 82-17]|uniref:FluC/FEX family fluoride channel n=1 Tax=Streptomyces sp. Da 82-17 TaxID=3377116 RepID=UPI0038D4A415
MAAPAPDPEPDAAPEPEPALDPLPVAPRPALLRGQGTTVAAVAAGGVVGAAGRYGASLLWPTPGGAFPWTTLWVNVVGCAAMGVLMVVITEGRQRHRLVRPFLGTGVLGGFTTFSTYTVDIRRLDDLGEVRAALGYLAATLVAALVAVWAAATATRRALNASRGDDPRPDHPTAPANPTAPDHPTGPEDPAAPEDPATPPGTPLDRRR